MAGRHDERTRYRARCTFTLDGHRHSGFVIDVSRAGLFIQTSSRPDCGTRLDIELVMRDEAFRILVEVARRKQVPSQLQTVARGGIGVRILNAPEEFYQALSAAPSSEIRPSASTPAAPSTPDVPKEAGKVFRVRVGQVTGTRTRTVRVSGADEAAARREALEDLGDDWKILEVEPV